MIDFNKEMVSALNKILPTHYELALTTATKIPCISYQERNNFSTAIGDTLGYSTIVYTIKVWSNKVEDLQIYSQKIDDVLRPIGFKRTSSGELYNNSSSMIQKIMTYEATGLEDFGG